ncbi:MAG: restriction endonuclease [Bacteroidota bacterium]
MPKVTRKRTGQFVRRLFEILLAQPEGVRAREAIDGVAESFILTDYERGEYDSGGVRFEKILRFATVDCVKAGWMRKSKGLWTVTEEGADAYETYTDPAQFYRQAVHLYRQWKKARDLEPDDVDTDNTGIEDEGRGVSVTFETAEEAAWSEVSEYLGAMNPYEFQELVADLLRAMGFYPAWVAPPGKDGGTDVIAYPDPLGTQAPRLKVQVKRQQAAVSVDGLRSFMAVLGDGDVGLFVSLGGFTRDAALEARTQEKRRVTLADAQRLFDLWVEHYDRLSDEARRRLPVKPLYFLSPEG